MITGSEGMAGAAILSASAAYRMGSGVVRILTPRCNQAVLQAKLPEVIVTPYKEEISRQMERCLTGLTLFVPDAVWGWMSGPKKSWRHCLSIWKTMRSHASLMRTP